MHQHKHTNVQHHQRASTCSAWAALRASSASRALRSLRQASCSSHSLGQAAAEEMHFSASTRKMAVT